MAIVVIDPERAHANHVVTVLGSCGWEAMLFTDVKDALRNMVGRPPALVVTELVMGTTNWYRCLRSLLGAVDGSRLVITTSYPSIASAVCATRAGASYLVKPVSSRCLAECVKRHLSMSTDELEQSHPIVAAPPCAQARHMSLDRVVWELINQVLAREGSLAAAARELGVDRRSLRRMLSKYPPPY